MDLISLEDLALKDFLNRIDQGIELEHGDTAIRKRMVESALIEDDADGLRLTRAGMELCKALAHRVAADVEVERILEQRADEEASEDAGDASNKR